jgi:hypothetical protein
MLVRNSRRTTEFLLAWAYAAVLVQVPVSGDQGVVGSNPAVPTEFSQINGMVIG